METFGQSITEPMACGTPVVAFDVTSQKDLVEDGINGYLAEFPNVEDLALKIKLGLFKGNKLRKQCRDHAVSRWSQNIIAKQYAKVYQECRAYIRR
jgi:glycosyltransferase involved in cell wall biosynthesis